VQAETGPGLDQAGQVVAVIAIGDGFQVAPVSKTPAQEREGQCTETGTVVSAIACNERSNLRSIPLFSRCIERCLRCLA
jgi:hypothetical protein